MFPHMSVWVSSGFTSVHNWISDAKLLIYMTESANQLEGEFQPHAQWSSVSLPWIKMNV